MVYEKNIFLGRLDLLCTLVAFERPGWRREHIGRGDPLESTGMGWMQERAMAQGGWGHASPELLS